MDYTFEEEELLEKILFQLGLLFIPSDENNYRPRFLQNKILLYCVVCLLLLRILTSVFSINFPKNIFFADITRGALMVFVNEGRQALGLQTLAENQKLDQAAAMKAQDMMNNEYFAHQSPQGLTPWYWFSQAGYAYKYAGENLAIGFLDSKEVYNAWYNSPTHKANMLNPNYKEFGTAVLSGNFQGNSATIIVQLFGSKLQTSVPVAAATKPVALAPKPQPEPAEAEQPKAPAVELEENQTIETSPEVLSQISEYPQLKEAGRQTGNTLYFQFLNFITYGYNDFLSYIIYGLLILVGIAILLNIVIHFNIQHGDLILRSFLILFLLAVATVVDSGIITLLIPHQIII